MTQQADRPRRRGYPRYGRFITTGALAGALAAVVIVLLAPAPEVFTRSQVMLYLAAVLALVGGLLAGGLAVLLEGRVRRADERRNQPADASPRPAAPPGEPDGRDSATP